MTIKRWFKNLFPSSVAKVREEKYGCRMLSARNVADTEARAITARVQELGPWFHNYEIASGIWTNSSGRFPGIEYPLGRWRLIEPLLPDVKGTSCLDVGCSSGFFSLKLKELGAAYVLGIDFEQQPQAIEQAQFAARTLGLDVDFRIMSAYDLATLARKFDVILFMGLFYHLRHPLVALEAAHAVCAGSMIFQTITMPHKKKLSELDPATITNVHRDSSTMSDDRFPALRFVEGTLDGDVTCWFIPNLQAVAAMLRSCGFQPGQVTFTTEKEIIVSCTLVK